MKTKLKFIVLILISFFSFLGCNDEDKTSSEEKIHGLNEKEIVKLWGNPAGVNYFVLTEFMFEERLTLQDKFPNYKDEKILIKEMYWFKGKMKRIVWFCKKNGIWVEVDNLIHRKSIQF